MKRLTGIYALASIIVVLLVGTLALTVYASGEKPNLIKWTNYDIGSSSYVQGTAVAEGILKKFGIKIRTMPLGNGIGRIMTVKTRASEFFFSAADAVYARKGIDDFAVKEWGPQKIRTVWMVKRKSTFAVVTRADSGVKKLSDLKGRKVAYIVGSPSLNAAVEGALNLVGLTWNDVQKVDYPSLVAGYNSVKDGKTDAVAMNSTSPVAYEMEASPGGIYWIPYPTEEENPQGWKEFGDIYPGTFPDNVTKGAGISPEKPVYTANFPFPNMFTYDFVDENTVYWQVKAIVESFGEYKDSTPDMPQWNIKECLKIPLAWAPWHEGAVKYFKEIGVWTPKMEQRNKELLDEEKKREALWEQTIEEATAQKIKTKQFADFWVKKLHEAGLK